MKLTVIKGRIAHDGKRLAVGDTFEATEEQANHLVKDGFAKFENEADALNDEQILTEAKRPEALITTKADDAESGPDTSMPDDAIIAPPAKGSRSPAAKNPAKKGARK